MLLSLAVPGRARGGAVGVELGECGFSVVGILGQLHEQVLSALGVCVLHGDVLSREGCEGGLVLVRLAYGRKPEGEFSFGQGGSRVVGGHGAGVVKI